jgi:hypothetical protein
MEHDDLTLNRRLRACGPPVDETAFDAALLARVRQQPVARRTPSRAVAVPVAAGATLATAAVVMLAGGPGDIGGPSSAAAITQALRWFDPPANTVLHVRSVERQGGHITTRELWQSADDPAVQREVFRGDQTYEASGDALYDPATNTIYENAGAKSGSSMPPEAAAMPASDPIMLKVRVLLERRSLEVKGRVRHGGVDAWEIALKQGAGRPVWRLWVSAADGRPLELRDPGRDASEPAQEIRWPTYEVVPAARSRNLLTLRGAHPAARVTRDPAQGEAAQRRLFDGASGPAAAKRR